MAIDPESLDLSIQQSIPEIGDVENTVSQRFSCFCWLVHNMRRMVDVYGRLRKKEDWAADPELVQFSLPLAGWINDLPCDLQVMYPADDSPPRISSHFVGNLHVYFHLNILNLHRPQLALLDAHAADCQWKRQMMICYNSAKQICRLQEAIIQQFGIISLRYMQRGVNFAIYTVLSCTVIHLVSRSFLCRIVLILIRWL